MMTRTIVTAALWRMTCNGCGAFVQAYGWESVIEQVAIEQGWQPQPLSGMGSRSLGDRCPECIPPAPTPIAKKPTIRQWLGLKSALDPGYHLAPGRLSAAWQRLGPTLYQLGWCDRGYRITDGGKAIYEAFHVVGDYPDWKVEPR